MSKIHLEKNYSRASVKIDELVNLRKELHRNPELSGHEKNTAAKIVEYIKNYSPSEIIENIGGYGVAAVYSGNKPGPTLMLRSELDALPIEETNKFAYRSRLKTIGHLCGHDGHSTILCGVAQLLADNPVKRGQVILLFQPAEETGDGAKKLINDRRFLNLKPDYIFGLHNLPGIEKNTIVMKDGIFAAASRGMIINLKGKASHAAEPENGINPSKAVAELITEITAFGTTLKEQQDFALITPIHVKIGEEAFGTSPGNAVVMLTLRSYENEVMDRIINSIRSIVRIITKNHKISFKTRFTEVFPATINDKPCFDIVLKSAMNNNYQIHIIEQPFKWSEDFGYYSQIAKTAFFGIGSGRDHPALHNPDYDFPDEIIITGIRMYNSIINSICK